MARIKPFKGILYNTRVIDDISKVVSPPYDVISEKMQKEYYRLHRNNVIRLILGKKEPGDTRLNNRYTRAGAFFEDWLKKGVLVKDGRPSLYIYEHRYLFRDRPSARLGFISLMKIEDPHRSSVLPHEYTFAKPKKDRLELIKATKANLCPIFSLFEDKRSAVTKLLRKKIRRKPPIIDIEHEGAGHRLWRLTDAAVIEKITNLMNKKQVFIADGHHRYEVALNFRDLQRKKKTRKKRPSDYVMVYFSTIKADALTILSTHRVIRSFRHLDFKKIYSRLSPYFDIEGFAGADGMLTRMEKKKKNEVVFGMHYRNEGFFTLSLKNEGVPAAIIKEEKRYKWKWLDVTVLHRLVFDHILKVKQSVANRENIIYTRDAEYAVRLVDYEGYEAAFFLNPPRIEQVKDMARSRNRMPHKTTYFYPKPLSGLVFYKMEF